MLFKHYKYTDRSGIVNHRVKTKRWSLTLHRNPTDRTRIDDAWEEWKTRVEEIKGDIQAVVNDLEIFKSFLSALEKNRIWARNHHWEMPADFFIRSGFNLLMMGIRRHLEHNRSDEKSFANLLVGIKGRSTELSYEFYCKKHPLNPNDPPWRWGSFSALSGGAKVVSDRIIDDDLRTIRNQNTSIRQFANQVIAHFDHRADNPAPTIASSEVQQSLDTFNQMFCKYICFLTGQGWATLTAASLEPWEFAWRYPLKEPPSDVRLAYEDAWRRYEVRGKW